MSSRMTGKTMAAVLVAAILMGGASAAQTAAPGPNVPLAKAIGQVIQTGPVASLVVMNARRATLADGKLTLTGVSPNLIAFADRPVRAAGHIETAEFAWYRSDSGNRTVNHDPHNNYYRGGGYHGGVYVGHL